MGAVIFLLRRQTCVGLVLACVLAWAPSAFSLTNGLALTPPMGWNDWNKFHCGIDEQIVRETADAIATNGMKAAGYVYVNIDDGWGGSRDSNGVIEAYSAKFPGGIKALADYVHAKGLKLGLYTDHGTNTCSSCVGGQKQPGSFGYEYIDAMTYAAWGVDYLKNDSCNQAIGSVARDDYFRMTDGLRQSGRPIVVSICENREHYEYWSPDLGNLWRTTGDISDSFSSMAGRIDPNSKSAFVAGPGRWNDPDMMEIGNGGMTDTEYRAHFTMWCIMAAPLVSGADLRSISSAAINIMTNAEAIAVDQDPAGEQGIRVDGTAGALEVWSKPLGYDFTTRAVALFNRTTNAAAITCNWTNLGLQTGQATVRDLWAHADLGVFTNSFTTNVPAHGAVLLKVVGTPFPLPPLGTTYLSDLVPIWAYTGFGTFVKDKSIGGNTITLDGVSYSKGIGTHAIGGHEFNLGGIAATFQSDVGVDDEVGVNGSVIFQVFADGLKIYDSGIMTGNTPRKTINLDVTGVRRLVLGVTDTGNDVVPGSSSRINSCHADWAGARVVVTNAVPHVPAAPTGLTANPGNPIELTWATTPSAIAYHVWRSTIDGGPYASIALTSEPTFADTDVVVGTTYFYVVTATNDFGASLSSAQAAANGCLRPSIPTGLQTASGLGAVQLRWNSAAGANAYTVARFVRNLPTTIVADELIGTNYIDTNVVGGTVYFYLVAAKNACSESQFSGFVAGSAIAAPAAPTGLNAMAGDKEILVTWNSVPQASSYNVKRSTINGGPYLNIATNVTSSSLLDTGLTNGLTYYYVVAAVNGAGESLNSLPASATPIDNAVIGLVGRFTFDDGTANDSSGNNNHGSLINGAVVIDDPVRGKILFLDGVDDYVDLGNSSSLDLSGSAQATVAAWVKIAATKNHNSILSKGEWKDAYSLLIKGDTTPVNLLWTGNDTSVFSADPIPVNTWTHVATTINGDLTTFYINGQISGATNQDRGNGIDNTAVDVCLGREQYSGSLPAGRWFFNGAMDEVRIYRVALAPGDIRRLAVSTAPPIRVIVSVEGDHLLLSWAGGVIPYQAQSATNLQSGAWQNLGDPIATNRLIVIPASAAQFYRIAN